MRLEVVETRRQEKTFLKVPRILYRNDPNWVCPPDPVIEGIFDPEKNRYFDNGEARRWVLFDDKGEAIGRVAAFYDQERAHRYDPPVGGMGFFECIDNQQAADLLFDACRQWLEEKGMGAMDGPVNFGENDMFWGLLVEGFTPPAFGMNYNPPYYRKLFENYGFKSFFEQDSRHLDLRKPFPERFWKIARWVISKPGYRFEHLKMKDVERFARDVVTIHNKAWVYHEHYTPLTLEKVFKSLRESKDVLEEDLIWFAYHSDQPIAFLVMIPDMNRIFRLFNGKLNLVNKLRFLMLKRSKQVDRARVTIMGVVPEFQGKGIESALFWQLREPLLSRRPHYRELEISWVGDFNPKMKAVLEAIGAGPGKIHITYRKLFSEKIPFRRAAKVTEIKEREAKANHSGQDNEN
ncbi:MAG: GNAT family N-acetyltransferase [Bacteroidales bacterium]